ncbi:undecaprenyldiphospho-muramoylpentapeptide beta-N-acetylglucosaminyltransferase [Vulcanibacillus modesticaldus]|uniref:UDP-N-acetylglucosamine--N-acetylmuramyl-(pentapeptide) pyrophosphoryl-undecaprenol N-acetylglucosamine transferase n=1 Tax=Vulcanibacillus modesticaldus TaxID=337097 RepID=A0A1D2YV15_9BACI|nr:undecaprenyldiphospho-muramoylpentapeptide beta-N-acetylglucosaminyltransferase [Vulcanibacillus modesticaldus]OEF99527.1 undecaprenyldiphospho-muramoylpentapeptide beta-N-acetylglucosaminyltransferase [Vulcanibacillus modesticaldus]
MRIIVTGGGTGGHIYPALAMVNEIKKHHPNAEVLYIGSERGLEKDIVKRADIPFVTIEISGFKRKLSLENLKTIVKFLKSVGKSKQYIKEFQPDVVIGTGGFVCGPVLYAASKLKIPTVVHEQNVIPGLTNKFLSNYVDLIAISFEGSKEYFKKAKRVVLTGNPRATEVVRADKTNGYKVLNITSDKKVILIFGGSRGAKAINQAFLEMLPKLNQYQNFHFVFVTGNVHYDLIQKEIQKYDSKLLKNIFVTPYLYNMPEILAITDLNISRAGASTLAEVTALGVPSILIPSPYVTNNHQEKNAKWLEEQGAAKMIKEQELSGDKLLDTIVEVMKNHQSYSQAAQNIGKPEAATKLLKEMETLIKKK